MSSVLFLSLMNGSSWGGSEELWYKTAMHSLQRGCKTGCAVYHWKEKEPRMQSLHAAGAQIYYLPNKGIAKRNLLEKMQFKITKKIRLKKAIRELPVDEYDLVVLNLGAFEIVNPVWIHFYKRLKKYALLFHNYSGNIEFSAKQEAALKEWIYRAQVNLFASVRIIELLEKKLAITINNRDILINPITFPPPSDITGYPPLKNGGYVFIMLAALEVYRKAQDQLIKALSSPKWKQRNWILELYGDGPDRASLQRLIEERDMKDKIFLRGHSANVKKLLLDAHMVLQITHMDAMPLAVVEGMAMSRPLVVSDVGDMPQWVKDGENGWVAPNASPEEIDRAMERAWSEKANWNEMGIHSFRVFRKKFNVVPEENLLTQLRLPLDC